MATHSKKVAATKGTDPYLFLLRALQTVKLHRSDIERRDAYQIAQVLTDAFQKFCATPVAQDSQPVK